MAKRVLDSGWQTGATYTLGKEVVSYRLLFSYTDNRTMTSADTLKIESSITFSAVETKAVLLKWARSEQMERIQCHQTGQEQ